MSAAMTAAVLHGPGDVRLERLDRPEAGPGEVLIRIQACGVCGTDAALYRGEYPARVPVVIGHEFSGEVAGAGEGVAAFHPGDRVTVDPNVVCHACEYCRGGREHLCEKVSSMGVHRDGADAEYCVMPAGNVYALPESVSFEAAAFCEPLACAVHGLDLAGVRLGDTVLVLGSGGMGNLIAQCARDAGAARVVVSEPIGVRRERALENGATDVLDPGTQDVQREIRRLTRIGADVVIEAAGNPAAQASCPSLVRKGGTVVWFGVAPQDRKVEVSPFWINENELRILGSYNNQFATARAVRLLAEGRVRVDNLVSHRLPLRDYPEVFRLFGGKDTLKLMVTMGD
jgi:2-desacetyl-2-hydroxyethyl bacteriochlorophyllide A dehydrogenase